MEESDIPDLRGENKNPPPGVAVNHLLEPPVVQADSAILKWDVSRQFELWVVNNSQLDQDQLTSGSNTKNIWQGQPVGETEITTVLEYPENPVAGNDDPPGLDEDANPYRAFPIVALGHPLGAVSSYDAPEIFLPNNIGEEGDNIDINYQFQEFVRLELNGKWYRVSSYEEWNMNLFFVKGENRWENNTSVTYK